MKVGFTTRDGKPAHYDVGVGSMGDEYDDLIATILFPASGIIVSQESGPGVFDVSFHSFAADAAETYDVCGNDPAQRVPLDVVLTAIEQAKADLLIQLRS